MIGIYCIALPVAVAGEVEPIPPALVDYKNELSTYIPESTLGDCKQTLVPIYDIETLEFLKFLETNFHSKNANSTLVNIAIARYAEYKQTMLGYLASVQAQSTTDQGESTFLHFESQMWSKCIDVTDTYILLTKQKMIDHIKANAAQKKTFMIYEKYKGISDRLRDMNFAIAQMYAFFETFNSRLEKFIPKCTQ